MFQTVTCVTAQCDHCHTKCWDGVDFAPHWPTRDSALRELAQDGWQMTGARMLCPGCTAVRTCQTQGHDLSTWRDCRCSQSIPAHTGGPGGTCGMHYRFCQRCDHHQERPAPPQTHPARAAERARPTTGVPQ